MGHEPTPRETSELSLGESGEWRELPDSDREVLFAAALLHDVAKPACTRHEDGRITSRGHSQRGAIQARRVRWEYGADFEAREQVCALVRYHQSPFHLINQPDGRRMAFLISQTARCDLLARLARADALGGKYADQADLLAQVELFRQYCGEPQVPARTQTIPSGATRTTGAHLSQLSGNAILFLFTLPPFMNYQTIIRDRSPATRQH